MGPARGGDGGNITLTRTRSGCRRRRRPDYLSPSRGECVDARGVWVPPVQGHGRVRNRRDGSVVHHNPQDTTAMVAALLPTLLSATCGALGLAMIIYSTNITTWAVALSPVYVSIGLFQFCIETDCSSCECGDAFPLVPPADTFPLCPRQWTSQTRVERTPPGTSHCASSGSCSTAPARLQCSVSCSRAPRWRARSCT